MKDVKVKLAIDESVTPFAQKHHHIPFYFHDKADNFMIIHLFDAGIIEPVNNKSEWVSPVVIVPKKNSVETRMCLDMTKLIKQLHE